MRHCFGAVRTSNTIEPMAWLDLNNHAICTFFNHSGSPPYVTSINGLAETSAAPCTNISLAVANGPSLPNTEELNHIDIAVTSF